jgi:hypothetical protein
MSHTWERKDCAAGGVAGRWFDERSKFAIAVADAHG